MAQFRNWLGVALIAGALALAADAPAQGLPQVRREGHWNAFNQTIAGTWQILDERGTLTLVLSEDFETRKAPDLFLYLSPKPQSELGNRNAGDGALFVGEVKVPRGPQRFDLPPETDLSQFRTLVLHCQSYAVLWGTAPLD